MTAHSTYMCEKAALPLFASRYASWHKRYASEGYLCSTEPNSFLAEPLELLLRPVTTGHLVSAAGARVVARGPNMD